MKHKFYGNQHVTIWGFSPDVVISILIVVIAVLIGLYILECTKPQIISPLSDNPLVYASEPTPEPTPAPTKPEIVKYIMQVFGQEGTHIGIRAINCFYSESGLRVDAYNYNTNNTFDYGSPQINQVHGYTIEELKDFRTQIDVAYKIYKKQGFDAWYGKECN